MFQPRGRRSRVSSRMAAWAGLRSRDFPANLARVRSILVFRETRPNAAKLQGAAKQLCFVLNMRPHRPHAVRRRGELVQRTSPRGPSSSRVQVHQCLSRRGPWNSARKVFQGLSESWHLLDELRGRRPYSRAAGMETLGIPHIQHPSCEELAEASCCVDDVRAKL